MYHERAKALNTSLGLDPTTVHWLCEPYLSKPFEIGGPSFYR
jgi:hypothetical protein